MTDTIEAQASLEAVLKDEIIRMYQDVADNPEGEFHFYHGRHAAELFDYDREALDAATEGAVASFAGVGNPHLRSDIQPGDTVAEDQPLQFVEVCWCQIPRVIFQSAFQGQKTTTVGL